MRLRSVCAQPPKHTPHRIQDEGRQVRACDVLLQLLLGRRKVIDVLRRTCISAAATPGDSAGWGELACSNARSSLIFMPRSAGGGARAHKQELSTPAARVRLRVSRAGWRREGAVLPRWAPELDTTSALAARGERAGDRRHRALWLSARPMRPWQALMAAAE